MNFIQVKGERPGAGLREEGPANLCIKRGEFWVFRCSILNYGLKEWPHTTREGRSFLRLALV